MDYQVTLTPQATEQVHQTMLYIAHTLKEPETANRWVNLLYQEIAKLGFMPSRHPLINEEPWRSKGIRKMPIKNFLVYYLIDEEALCVSVIAIIYERRDQLSALKTLQ
jgi:toxin ParE1/3/4